MIPKRGSSISPGQTQRGGLGWQGDEVSTGNEGVVILVTTLPADPHRKQMFIYDYLNAGDTGRRACFEVPGPWSGCVYQAPLRPGQQPLTTDEVSDVGFPRRPPCAMDLGESIAAGMERDCVTLDGVTQDQLPDPLSIPAREPAPVRWIRGRYCRGMGLVPGDHPPGSNGSPFSRAYLSRIVWSGLFPESAEWRRIRTGPGSF